MQITHSAALTNVPGIQSIDGPGGDKAEIDVTSLADTAAQKVTGFPDYGTMTINGVFDPANAVQATLRGYCETANATSDVNLIFPDTGNAAFLWEDCQFKNWRFSFQQNDAVKFSCEIVMNGAPTVTT